MRLPATRQHRRPTRVTDVPLVGRLALASSRTRIVRNGGDTACGYVREPDPAFGSPPAEGRWPRTGVPRGSWSARGGNAGLIPRASIHKARVVRRLPGKSERRADGRDATRAD